MLILRKKKNTDYTKNYVKNLWCLLSSVFSALPRISFILSFVLFIYLTISLREPFPSYVFTETKELFFGYIGMLTYSAITLEK